MKILRLSFKNLNSLAGCWEIDFGHPDFVSSGIFAITGPTGAGKSTVLDAICLALYGQTPRLSRITQSDNEIMARQTGECFAEVDFETAKGRFRCHWSQHRSRKQADGQLQSPRHEISVAETGVILESRLRSVVEKVEAVTGMDFDRFTRSMLLAQGGFAAFLQARPDERAPILEQITGTAIYSRISVKVHERTQEERRKLAELRLELDGILLLSPTEEEVLLQETTDLQAEKETLDVIVATVSTALSWREKTMALEDELQKLDLDLQAFATRKEEAAPEMELLVLAGRALNLAGDHAHLMALRAQHAREQAEHATVSFNLPHQQVEWQSAFEAETLADAELAAVRNQQLCEAELIKKTRAIDVVIREADAQLKSTTDTITQTGLQNRNYRRTIADMDSRMAAVADELLAVSTFFEEQRADASLVGTLTGIEQLLRAMSSLDKQQVDTMTRLTAQLDVVDKAARERNRTESVWREAVQASAVTEQRLTELREAGVVLLLGQDSAAWRGKAEALAERQRSLQVLQECEARIGDGSAQLAKLTPRIDALEQQRQALGQKAAQLDSDCRLREQLVHRLQDNVLLLSRVQSLENDRRLLVDGRPCPLCGSGEHPYAVGNIPKPDEVKIELDQSVAELKCLEAQLSSVKQELVAVDKDIEQAVQLRNDLQKRQLGDEDVFTRSAAELDLSKGPDGWFDVIGAEFEVCGRALADVRVILETAESNDQKERTAQAEVNRLKDVSTSADKSRLAALLGHESAQSERDRLENEAVTLGTDCRRVKAEVEEAVTAYGYFEVIPAGSDELLSALTARHTSYVDKLQVREQLDKALANDAAERGKQLALLEESEKRLIDMERQFQVRLTDRDHLVEQRLELYGERNTDSEEKKMAELLSKADALREAARLNRQHLQAGLDGLRQRVEMLAHSIDQGAEQLAKLESAFIRRLEDFGFKGEAAFVAACLSQERFDELSAKNDALNTEETSLRARQQDRRIALEVELAKKMTDKLLELLREEQAAAVTQVNELQKRLGAHEQKLRQHAEQKRTHMSRLREIETQKVECDRWEKLHSLIGSGDGKKFRNFAQGLTFELMVAHANSQLHKMSDRYILVRDRVEPLELNVIDNYQAGEIRSTRNLSGGESFVASLALALGLSGMASRNVRVDSLFLDEGFGTLDEDALETALETLSGLQQEGKLIGIISHVAALKERIGTQIKVDVGCSGRSRLSGPGCRSVV